MVTLTDKQLMLYAADYLDTRLMDLPNGSDTAVNVSRAADAIRRAIALVANAGAGDDDTIATLRQQAITDAGIIDKLSTQVVHAQMLLQTALGYEEVDYHISLTDLEADILALRQQLADARAALAFYATYEHYRMPLIGHSLGMSAVETDNGERAREALQAGESGEG